MATSSGIVTRSRAKILQTTITPYISDEEEKTEKVSVVGESPSKRSSSIEQSARNLGEKVSVNSKNEETGSKNEKTGSKNMEAGYKNEETDEQVSINPRNKTVSNGNVLEESLPELKSSRKDADKVSLDGTQVIEIDSNIDGVVVGNKSESEPGLKPELKSEPKSESKPEPFRSKSEPCIPVDLNPSKESNSVIGNGVENGSHHSSSGSAVSVKEAIEVVLKQEKGPNQRKNHNREKDPKQEKGLKQFDDDYEEDGFVLKAKRKSCAEASNGHVLAVEPLSEMDDADMDRINFLFGEYEYEDRDGPKDESEEESILSDPSDLDEESEPEEDLIEDDIENYGKDLKPRKTNYFIDDEAVVDNTNDEDQDAISYDEDQDAISSDDVDSDEDRAIRAPLKKKDFLDEEAIEDNNLKSLYGWTDCTSSEDESKGKGWEWNEDSSESDEESYDEDEDENEDEDQESSGDEKDEEFTEEKNRSSKSRIILYKGCLDSSEEEGDSENCRKRKRRVIEDEEEDETVCEDEVQVVGQVEKNSSQERKNVSSMKKNPSPQMTIQKNTSPKTVSTSPKRASASPKRSISPDSNPREGASSFTDIVVQSTSSVFVVTPLKTNYQPGRHNKQILNVTPLETTVSSLNLPSSQAGTNTPSSHLAPSQNSAPKRKRGENNTCQEVICKKVKRCNIPDDFILSHDLVFIINSSSLKSGSHESDVSKGIEKVTRILKKCLEDRVSVIDAKVFEGSQSSVVGAKASEESESSVIAIGLNLNVDRAYECVVKGPSADQKQEVKRFRKLWGNKAEIRRYPDLSILVSVYFEAKTLAERRNIVPRIVRYIFSLHLKIDPCEVLVFDQAINCVLSPKRRAFGTEAIIKGPVLGTGEEELLSLSESLERLKKKLRDLKDLPLRICSIRPISPAFRGGEVFPPRTNLSNKVATCKTSKSLHGCLLMPENVASVPALVKPQEVVIELETSGKWPDDLLALRHVTTQILYNLMIQLHLKYKLPVRLKETFLDVLHDSIVFRIHIAVKKEIILLRQFETNAGFMLAKRGQVPEADLLELRNDFLPLLTSALNGLSTQFLVYNTVVRLAKRWLSSQYLWTLVSEIVIELIVARVFLSPSDRGYTAPPNSPLVGFLRFLELVSRFKWDKEPLFINLNNELTREKEISIKKSFQQMKMKSETKLGMISETKPGMKSETKPGMKSDTKLGMKPAFMICTPYDVIPGVFSKSNGIVNSRPIFDTFVRNCRSTFNYLMGMVRGSEPFNFLRLFQHPTEEYHVIIHLKHEFISTSTQSLDPNILSSNKQKMMENVIPVTDFDIVQQYLDSLRIRYEKDAVFFYDHFGGSKILVTFTPETLKTLSECSSGSKYEKVIEDFETLAHGIVKEIKVNVDKWV